MSTRFLFILALMSILFILARPVYANQPILKLSSSQATRDADPYQLFASSTVLGDPTFSGYTVYATLGQKAIDMYYFIPKTDDIVPIEILTPAKSSYANFFPRLTIVGKYVASGARNPSDVPVPIGFESATADSPATHTTTFDSLGLMNMYTGTSIPLHVIANQTYFIGITDPANLGGAYALKIGTKTNLSGSVKDTATTIDTNGLAFENVPLSQSQAPSPGEQSQFAGEKTPFQTLDSRIRLWTDIIGFYFNRIPAVLFNK